MRLPSPLVKLPDCQQNWDHLRKPLVVVPLSFAANWTDYATSVPDASQTLCGSYVNRDDEVVVHGLARRVVAVFGFPTTIGTLPVEHRPATNHVFTCWSTDTSSQNSIWAVLVQTSGAIIAFSCVGSASGAAGTYVYLDGIRFRKDG